MRHDSRQDTPRRAGGRGSGATESKLQQMPETGVLEPAVERRLGGAGSREGQSVPEIGARLAGAADHAESRIHGLAVDAAGQDGGDLPLVETADEEELAAELARDLEQLREASEQVALASAWLDNYQGRTASQGKGVARETTAVRSGYPVGSERVQSSRGRTSRPKGSPPAAWGSDIAGIGGQPVNESSAESDSAHQEWAPMKNPTPQSAVTNMPRKDRRENVRRPTEVGSPGQAAEEPPQVSASLGGEGDRSGSATAKLEYELREAREALKRLRDRAAVQMQMYGSVGAQSRKLDQRAAELRARVAKAQEALNERARKLQTALERERDRLRAYHSKLQHKAKELSDWTRMRKRQLEEEAARERAIVEAERESLARREQELERRFAAHAASDQRQLELRRAELEQTIRARLTEIERDAEARRADLEAREEALLRREMEQAGRLKAFEESRRTGEHSLKYQEEELARRMEEDQARVAEEMATLRRQLEEQISRREAELAAREEAVGQVEAEARRRGNADRAAELEKREAELVRLSAALEVRERRLQEWQVRIDQTEARLETVRQGLEQEANAAQQAVSENKRQSEDLKARREKVEAAQVDVEAKRQEIEVRAAALAEKESLLAQAVAEVDEQKRQNEEQARRLADEQRKLGDFAERARELAEERAALDKAKAEQADELASLQREKEKLATQQTSLDEARLALELDSQRLAEQEEHAVEIRSALQREREQLEVERRALAAEQEASEQRSEELAKERASLAAEKGRIEGEHARLERESIALRDRERVLAEEQAGVETARQEAERYRSDLAKRIEEMEEFRRQLAEKAAHLKARKEQLAKDAATVDERLKTLHGELAKVAEKDRRFEQERQQLEIDRRSLETDRERLDRCAEELDESRRTFQAGLRSLEESRRHMAEREARLGDRAGELEELRKRLEGERADLHLQRQELLSLQEERSSAAQKVQSLMVQAEAMQSEARRREELSQAHEQALTARAAQLSRAEEELVKRKREQEAQSRSVAAEMEELESKRRELESVVEFERAELEKSRRAAEAEIASERARLEQRASELEVARAVQGDVLVPEEIGAAPISMEEMRRRVETELSERLAEVARKEESTEARCRARWAELERDIEERLTALEGELKDRREGVEREVSERTRAAEEAARSARGRVDEQIEDLRRRQAALSQEQALLAEERRQLQKERTVLVEMRRRMGEEGTPLDVESFVAADGEGGESLAETPMMAEDDGGEAGLVAVDELQPASDLPSVVEPELAGEEPALAVPAVEGQPEMLGVAPGQYRRRCRIRAAGLGVVTALVGCLAAGAYLFWPVLGQKEIKGRIALAAVAPGASLSPADHIARMTSDEVLDRASRESGRDVRGLYQSGKITLTTSSSGEAVELTALVPEAQQADARRILDAWGEAYQESLSGSVITSREREARLAELESTQDRLTTARDAAAAELDKLRAALQANPLLEQVESARGARAERKAEVVAAHDAWEEAKSSLTAFEATPPPEEVAPTEEQLALACAADAEVMRAIEQRDSKARELHKVLTEAMSRSQTPLARLLTSISELSAEVDQQLAEQTDQEIRRELEQIGVNLKDYRHRAEAFSRSWDELAPKVAAWKAGGDAELLLEYQKTAESLIREFHSESGKSFGAAAQKADAIGRAGSEMTKRRIIQARLLKASNASLEARNEWIVAARGVIPRHNLELKALAESIRDLTPRIEERRRRHREQLAEHLTKVRADERAARLRGLREQADEAGRRYQRLSEEYLKSDADVSVDGSLAAELQRQQVQVRYQEELLARLDQELSDTVAEAARLRNPEEVSLAGAVVYESLPFASEGRLAPERRVRAIQLGAAVAAGFLAILMARSSWRRHRDDDRRHPAT